MTSRLRALSISFLVLISTACSGPELYLYVEGDHFKESEHPAYFPADSYRLVIDGQPSEPFKVQRNQSQTMTLPVTDPLPKFGVQMHTPCGWEDAEVDVRPDFPDFGNKRIKAVTLTVKWEPGDANSTALYVDNRAAKTAANVNTGERKATVEAGKAMLVEFPRLSNPKCESAKHIQLNGQNLLDPPKVAAYVVDTSASHCYYFRSNLYGGRNYKAAREFKNQQFWKPQRVRQISDTIDFFLVKVPDKIETNNPLSGAEIRTSLEDADCAEQ
jgi:hypothetical protein